MIRFLLLGILSILLAGCGFHLRGVEKISPKLDHLYISSKNPNGQMVQTLERLLTANNIKLAKNATGASSVLKIISANQSQQATAIIGGAQATTYTLTNTVTFSILNSDQTLIYGPETVRASREYSSNASQSLTNAHKAQALKDQLQSNLANQILQQLTNVTTNASKVIQNAS